MTQIEREKQAKEALETFLNLSQDEQSLVIHTMRELLAQQKDESNRG